MPRGTEHMKNYRWPKGVSGNPKGRPPGSISPRDKIRQMFENDPDAFHDFLTKYVNDPVNRKHVVELLDGKPHQSIDHTTGGKELPIPILNVFTHDSNEKDNVDEQENSSDTGGDISE